MRASRVRALELQPDRRDLLLWGRSLWRNLLQRGANEFGLPALQRDATPAAAHSGSAALLNPMNRQLVSADRLFWGTIAFGFLVPVLVVEFAAAVLVGGRPFGQALADLPRILFAPGYGLFVIVLLTAIPFVVLAFVIRSELRGHGNKVAAVRTKHIARVVGAAAFVTGFVLAVQVGIWVRTYGTGRGVSTAGIGLYLLPLY